MSITTSGVTNTSSSSSYITLEDSTSLSMSDFFELLAAELQNQNVLDPVDNSEFIAQMAQFSTLSQMKEMANVCQMSYSISLLGHDVTISSTDDDGTSTVVSGTVDNIYYESGVPYVEVDGAYYLASDVVLVTQSEDGAASDTAQAEEQPATGE